MYLFLDTESGDLITSSSLLELGFIITDPSFNVVDEIVFKLKPDDGIYLVSAQGLSVNKINLVEHDRHAITYKVAKATVYNYLKDWWERSDREPLIPVGKNIHTDLNQIWDKLLAKATWDQFVSYQPLEISGAVRFLQAQRKIPLLESTSLTSLCKYFNIIVKDEHTSLGDCRMGLKLMRRLVQL